MTLPHRRQMLALGALAAFLCGGCEDDPGRNSVAVVVHHGPGRNGHVTLASVELQACPQAAWTIPLVSTAHARSAGTSAQLADATVIRLGDSPTAYGVLHPPDASYCSVMVTFGPADEDARDVEDTGMEGLTFTLDGFVGVQTVEVSKALDPALTLEAETAVTLDVTLTLPGGFADPLAAHQALRRAVGVSVRRP